MRAFLRDNIDHVIKDSIVIGCVFSQSGKVTICAFGSILRPEYIPVITINGISKWYALHKILVRGPLRVPFIFVRSIGFFLELILQFVTC